MSTKDTKPATATTSPCIGNSDNSDAVIGEIEQFLMAAILQMEPDRLEARRTGPGRPRILPSLCLWAGLLVCVLKGLTGQSALWRLLTTRNFWFYPRFPVSDQAVYKRLEKAGTEPMERLFKQISSVLAERLAPFVRRDLAPFASEVVALDETTLDPVARKLPSLRAIPKGDSRLLAGKLAGLFDLRRQQWRTILHIPSPHQNEKVAARSLLEGLTKGALVLADLGYFGFAWFDDLTDSDYYWLSRLRLKTTYEIIHVFYENGDTFDGIVWLGAYRADRAAHAVRLVHFRIGDVAYSYITNILDPKVFPMIDIARLYARRWDIEMAVNTVKTHLNLHLLWSSKPVVVMQQVWAVLIIAQILQALRVEIAGRAGVDIFEVSLPLLIEYMPHYAEQGQDPVEIFVELGRELRFIRPSRRTKIKAPLVPQDEIVPLPPNLVLLRTPRYANRNCGPRQNERTN